MSLAAVVSLMLVLIMPDGQTKRMFIEQPSLFACFEETQKFMQHKPEEFKAIAVGAGCVHHPSRPLRDPAWLTSAISKIGKLHDGADVVALAQEIARLRPDEAAY